MKGFFWSVAFLALSAGPAVAQSLECNLFTSDGTPAPVPVFFALDQPNRRAVARNGAVFALEVEERRYRLSRRETDGSARVFVIDRNTGYGAWGLSGVPNAATGSLRCSRAPPRL